MQEITTHVDIPAAPAEIWAVLTDFARYADWNPFIRRIDGVAATGARLTVSIAPPGQAPMTFRPIVQTMVPEREFIWLGRVVMPGLFDGRHSFRLEALPGGHTRFHHEKQFSGILVALFWNKMRGPTEAGFNAMNAALKARFTA